MRYLSRTRESPCCRVTEMEFTKSPLHPAAPGAPPPAPKPRRSRPAKVLERESRCTLPWLRGFIAAGPFRGGVSLRASDEGRSLRTLSSDSGGATRRERERPELIRKALGSHRVDTSPSNPGLNLTRRNVSGCYRLKSVRVAQVKPKSLCRASVMQKLCDLLRNCSLFLAVVYNGRRGDFYAAIPARRS